MMSGGGALAGAGLMVSATGEGAIVGIPAAGAGATTAVTGAGLVFGGVYLMANTANNASQGYQRGKVPNPNGKKGSTAHQQKVSEVEKTLQDDGYETQREVKVNTPRGEKRSRFIDVQGKKPQSGEMKSVQVGKQNKNGTPVSRERKAINDIQDATGHKPDFVPYNK
jgi:hypothetical protein